MKVFQAEFVGSYPDFNLAPGNLTEIAFGGRSNVGKSSLLNSLVNRKNLAQVAKSPGKTRLLNYFILKDPKERGVAYFVDLPGYGYASVSEQERKAWKSLVETYVEKSKNLKGFILLIDSRRGVQDEELQLVDYLRHNNRDACIVLTKTDKLSKSEVSSAVKTATLILGSVRPSVDAPIAHSAKTNSGNDLIWRWIMERIDNAAK